MRIRSVIGVAAVLAAGAGGVVLMTNDDDSRGVDPPVDRPAVVQAEVIPAAAEAVMVLDAEPGDTGRRSWLDLDLPEAAEPSTTITGDITWTTPSGTPITGQVAVQRVDGAEWATVAEVPVDTGSGTVDLDVEGTAIYRVVYAGSADVGAAQSDEMTVQAGDLLSSTLAVAATPVDDTGYEITASWATADSVAVRGTLAVQQEVDGEWTEVGEVGTGDTGAGSTIIAADELDVAATFRLVYSGGSRFAAIASEPATAYGDDIRTIPVSTCSTDHEIDVLPRGAGCHFTPVTSGTFVVGHDYLDNSWWNAVPMGTVIELEGAHAGIYEVVDRVIAPGRGAALGSASNWTCGDACDVILQTCQGSDTGFTWLRRVT